MADNKKMVEAITSMDTDFAQWYTDVVKKAELCDYASVKAVWSSSQLDMRSGRTSRKNWTADLKRQVYRTYTCLFSFRKAC